MSKRLQTTVIRLLLCAAILLDKVPTVGFAAEVDGRCEHHMEHLNCGYTEGVPACGYECDLCAQAEEENTKTHTKEELAEATKDVAALTAKTTGDVDTSRYYYNQLSSQEKYIYDTFLNQIYGDPDVNLIGIDTYSEQVSNQIERALRALKADYPIYSLYWSDDGFISSKDTIIFSRNRINAPDWLLSTVQARIDQYVASIDPDADRYSQIYELYQIMYNEVYYDDYFGLIGHNAPTIHSVYGCLGYGLSVCDGFAYSVKIICDSLSIPCIFVAGQQPGDTDGHTWNYIQMEDGRWYNFDTSARFGMPTYILGGKNAVLSEESFENGIMHDFVVPNCPEQPYIYTGTINDDSYVLVPNAYLDAPGTFVYEVNKDGYTCTITDYYGSQKGDLRIPAQIDGYTVTEIAPMAFYARIGFTGDIIIPDTVTTIGDSAFRQCYGISGTLTLPKQLVSIGAFAFLGNTNMTGSLDLPDTIRSIGRMAFHDCKSLTGSVTLPEGVKEVDFPFYDCSGLDGILYIPDSLEKIEGLLTGTNFKALHVNDTNSNYSVYEGVLYSKDMRTMIACPTGKQGNLTIPEGVVRIAGSACNGCSGLTGRLVLPESLQIIEPWAFANTSFNGDLTIPDSVTEIGAYAFICAGFDGKLKLPSGLERIEDGAFQGCGFTGTLELPNSVTYIGDWAFYQNSFTGTAIIPEKVTYVGQWLASGWYSEDSSFCCAFKGDAPEIHTQAFSGYKTTISYPSSAFGWPDIVNNNYDVPEPITWLAICEDHELMEWKTYQEPTCTADGSNRRDCSRCDYFEVEVISATGHDYEAVVTEPTWESGGYTTYTCVECGDSYQADFTDPLPYVPGDADGDGTVNTDDAIYLLYNVMFGDEDYPVNQKCDFDGNGTVNTDDAIYLLYHVMFGGEDYPLRN